MKENSSNTGATAQTQAMKRAPMATKKTGKSMSSKLWLTLRARIEECSAQVAMIGIDIGDRVSELCVLSHDKQVLVRGGVATDWATMERFFQPLAPTVVVMETGTHSPWMDRLIRQCGHRVLVASAREVSRVLKNKKKNDRRDAEQLARLAAADEALLGLVKHRGQEAQLGLGKVKVRDHLVKIRTGLCNTVRGLVKSHGHQLPKAAPEAMRRQVAEGLQEELQDLIAPLLQHIEQLNESIRELDKELEELGRKKYPQTSQLQQIYGVGPIVSLAFVLTMDDPQRFGKSRDVGSYLGLTPGQDESGASKPELRITKEGDGLMRTLLVNAAQTVMRKNSPECDLKRHGMKLAAKGDKTAKKKAVVAVGRKLAVLMHKLLVSKTPYNPQHNVQERIRAEQARQQQAARKAAA